MNQVSELLFSLLRVAVCDATVDDSIKDRCTPEILDAVYTVAMRHDLAHLLGQAVSILDLPESAVVTKCKQMSMQAFYRYMRMNCEFERVCNALEDIKVPFIPLKGAVLREFYPEPWMRTSCDIDILIKEDMLDSVVSVLVESLGYTSGNKSDHDISLYSSNGVHLELHFNLFQERYSINNSGDILLQIWENAIPGKLGSFHYYVSDEMFYYYHMSHMIKHFEVGGCGIRAFLDIWILNHKREYDKQRREKVLQEGGLLKFAQASEKISEVWFSGLQPDPMLQQIENYILRASLYGNNENRAAIGQAQMGGKLRYLILRRVFMPYNFIKDEYPILKKRKWLLPAFQVVRWGRMLRCGGLQHSLLELNANVRLKKMEDYSATDILRYMGLQ